MRGIDSTKVQIRHKVFTEIARLAYSGGDLRELDDLPFKIVPGEIATYRDSIFLERAIVGERLRAAMGMGLRKMTEHAPISKGVDATQVAEKYYEPPLIDIIKFACHKCPDNKVWVTNGCQGCFDHPCQEVCPKGAVSMVNGRSFIDQSKCIKCGKCADACQYHAIIHQKRPCKEACGLNAITMDEYGRAQIDHKKCVACGMCLVSCPFAAIVDKGQIYQTIMAIKSDTPVYAIIAPSIAGQFGPALTSEKMRPAFKALGFAGVYEVALGADLCTIEEASDFLEEVPDKLDFMVTSCCPAWVKMVQNEFPDYVKNVSMALTPMVLTARLVKKKHPDAKIAFIGPCLSKKEEASRKSIKSYVDFALTFEEVAGMFNARDINFDALPEDKPLKGSSGDGRGFAKSGGVAAAVTNLVKRDHPDIDVKVQYGNGLKECKKMMLIAKAGKYNGCLLEGMACPGGCIAGAGTLRSINDSTKSLLKDQKDAGIDSPADNDYRDWIPDLETIDKAYHQAKQELISSTKTGSA
ncbi:MAG: 4Fe-4S dicluster domain-containing protein [Lachnospiraceae bacterium]|nr:4Fe-4S dicluster domain-containing protein [Lachnospiraceae bacterium]MEE3460477.1 4Fe-4S dicluster domain-containing protein [Lachnospiraceae bacterium]